MLRCVWDGAVLKALDSCPCFRRGDGVKSLNVHRAWHRFSRRWASIFAPILTFPQRGKGQSHLRRPRLADEPSLVKGEGTNAIFSVIRSRSFSRSVPPVILNAAAVSGRVGGVRGGGAFCCRGGGLSLIGSRCVPGRFGGRFRLLFLLFALLRLLLSCALRIPVRGSG